MFKIEVTTCLAATYRAADYRITEACFPPALQTFVDCRKRTDELGERKPDRYKHFNQEEYFSIRAGAFGPGDPAAGNVLNEGIKEIYLDLARQWRDLARQDDLLLARPKKHT